MGEEFPEQGSEQGNTAASAPEEIPAASTAEAEPIIELFGEHVANAQTAACALVLALPADVAGLWSERAREECRLHQLLEQWNVRSAGFIKSPPRPAPG